MTKSVTVLGIMSGTSGDGIDLAYVRWNWHNTSVTWQLVGATTLPFTGGWSVRLQALTNVSGVALLEMDRTFGTMLGTIARQYWEEAQLPPPDLIAAHGYTFWHDPSVGVSHQLGHGATIAAAAGVPAIVDFRAADVAYGGQGAPLAPMGDTTLFPGNTAYLNLGGIANLYLPQASLAFDVGGANLLLNALAKEAGLAYDKNGQLAATGMLQPALLDQLLSWDYHNLLPPKSLDAGTVTRELLPILQDRQYALSDRMHTAAAYIGQTIGEAGKKHGCTADSRLLVTGGGTYHSMLIQYLTKHWPGEVFIPPSAWIDFKEAILFAYFGALRWYNIPYISKTLTGATKDTTGGAIYLP